MENLDTVRAAYRTYLRQQRRVNPDQFHSFWLWAITNYSVAELDVRSIPVTYDQYLTLTGK